MEQKHGTPAFNLLREVLSAADVGALLEKVDTVFAAVDAGGTDTTHAFQTRALSPRGRFVPTASSLSLDAVLDDGAIAELINLVGASAVGTVLRERFPEGAIVDLDQAWLRRQFARMNYPRFHAPHSWHQDGALGMDFSGSKPAEDRAGGLLDMLTCWIALTDCGHHAPGLEVITDCVYRLLLPHELSNEAISSRHAPEAVTSPVLNAGDGVVFPGGTLHRTHVTDAMTGTRTSLELRFFSLCSPPARLTGDRFLPLKVG